MPDVLAVTEGREEQVSERVRGEPAERGQHRGGGGSEVLSVTERHCLSERFHCQSDKDCGASACGACRKFCLPEDVDDEIR